MADKPEILVHVGAPSAAGDDARYRALVESSLVFAPVSHYSVFRIHESDNGADLEVSVDNSRSLLLTSAPASSSSSFARQSSLPRHEQTMSFNSGDELCSLVTPYNREESIITQDAGTLRQPKETPPNNLSLHAESTDEDSYLSFQPLIPLSHAQDKPESFQKTASMNEESAGTGTFSSEAKTRNPSIVDIQLTRDELSTWDTPLDVIPDSQENDLAADQTILDYSVQVDRSFVPDSARQSRHIETNKVGTEESRLSDISRIPSSVPSPSPERTSERHVDLNSEAPPQSPSPSPNQLDTTTSVLGKRKAVGNGNNNASISPQQPPNVAVASSSSSSSSSRLKKRQTLPEATETISLTTLPIEIRSPNPPVSNSKFRTHVTPTLKALSERMKHPSRFMPTQQTRTLQPLERGYWFIPCITIIPDTTTTTTTTNTNTTTSTQPQTWPQTFFSQFWCFLRDFLTEGRAGWGIWCLLEESPIQSPPINLAPTSVENARVVNLKLYTWGEVATHIYLLLFLATERRIKKMRNVEWRDARDEAVLVM
ncbi:hypothetical protein UA08_06046 [Talaromyces atroroseus]|uniref:Uncharacterized protein n=1 Tax=Talaromyces atroroseus TaxID=1441469 RepID=A0A225ADZ5_TALAT|nr:hypothetical protein UA08_06046 [Talaromyces atroroseus]OKL58710.1 hypothetical protein UA08_06046 [Talaromyces atroroseus]